MASGEMAASARINANKTKKIKKNERCYLEVRKDTIRILSEFNKLELLPQFEWSKMRDKKMQDELVMELQKRF